MNKVGARTMHAVALGVACVLLLSVTPTLAGTDAPVPKQQSLLPLAHPKSLGGFFSYNIETDDGTKKEQQFGLMPLPLEFMKEDERRTDIADGHESQRKKKEEVFVQEMNVEEPDTDVFQQFTDDMSSLVTDLMAPFEKEVDEDEDEDENDATGEDEVEDKDGFFAGNVFGDWFNVPWLARTGFNEPHPHPHPHPFPFPHPHHHPEPFHPDKPPPPPKVCEECLEVVTEKLIGQATKKLECMCAGIAKKCSDDAAAKTDYCHKKEAWCAEFKKNPKFGIHFLREHFDFMPRMEALSVCSKAQKCPPPPPPHHPPHWGPHHHEGPPRHHEGPPRFHLWGPPHPHHDNRHDDDVPLAPFFNTIRGGTPRKAAPSVPSVSETPAQDSERRPIRDAVRKTVRETGDFFRRLFG